MQPWIAAWRKAEYVIEAVTGDVPTAATGHYTTGHAFENRPPSLQSMSDYKHPEHVPRRLGHCEDRAGTRPFPTIPMGKELIRMAINRDQVMAITSITPERERLNRDVGNVTPGSSR